MPVDSSKSPDHRQNEPTAVRCRTRQVITGNRYCSYEEMSEVIQVAVRGLVKPVVTKRVALEDVEEVFDTLSRRTLLGRAAIVVD